MNYLVAVVIGYLSVGLLIVSFYMRPKMAYRTYIDDRILEDGGISFRVVLMVALLVCISPFNTALFILMRPIMVMKERKAAKRNVSYHTKYRKLMGYGTQSVGICELCHKPYAHVHHVEPKGMGGRKNADDPDNLIGLCVGCHDKCHGSTAKLMKVRCQGAIAKRNKFFKKQADRLAR